MSLKAETLYTISAVFNGGNSYRSNDCKSNSYKSEDFKSTCEVYGVVFTF